MNHRICLLPQSLLEWISEALAARSMPFGSMKRQQDVGEQNIANRATLIDKNDSLLFSPVALQNQAEEISKCYGLDLDRVEGAY